MKKNIRILIVDDSRDDALIVQRLLAHHTGHRIKTDSVEDLKGALDKLAKRDFDVVLLDDRLGGDTTAREAIESFKEQNIDVPVIIITGQGDEQIAVELMKMGAYDYIIKEDLTVDKLEKAIFNAVEQHTLKVRHSRDQQLLKESEGKYRTLVEDIPAMVCRFNSYYELTFANKAYRKCFNQTNEQLLGSSLFEFIPKEYHESARQHYKLLCKEHPVATAEYKVTTAGGRQMWQQWTAGIVFDEAADKIIGYQAVGYDVTERKQMEEKLSKAQQELEEHVRRRTAELDKTNKELLKEIAERKEAENELAEKWIFFRTVLDNLPDHIYAKDRDSRFTLCNIALADAVWVKHPNDLLGKTDFDVFPLEQAERFFRDEQNLIKTSPLVLDHEEQLKSEKRLTEIGSYKNKRKKGQTEWILSTKLPFRNTDGEIIGLVGIGHNITKLKEAEETLTKDRNLLRALIDNLPDYVYVKDVESRFTLCNITLSRSVGAKHPDELLGKTDFDFFPRNLAEKFFNDEQKIIKTGQPLINRQEPLLDLWKYQGQKSEGHWVLTTKVPLLDDNGEVIGIVGIGHDITEIKKAQQKLRSLASEISLAEERLRHRIADNVHDRISQNLAISKIKLDSLRGWSSSPEFSETLAQISQMLEQTIESMRSLTFELSPPVLYELGFESAINWLVRQTRKRDGLDAEFEDDQSDKPLHDDVRVFLFQAVRELLVNVVKHSGAKSVKVRSVRKGNEVRVSVKDNGGGFDVSKTSWEDYEKAGFGLFSIHERLSLIGGRLDVKSSPGKGTAITLVVPIETKK